MLRRVVTALVGLVVFFAVIFAGEIAFTAAVSIVTACMLYEVYKSIKTDKALWFVGYAGGLLILSSIIFGQVSLDFAMTAVMFIYLAAMVFLHGRVSSKEVGINALLTLFISIFFGSMIKIYVQFGITSVLIVFICAWMTDTGAYFAGRAFGKHKLMPRVSPKKTIEGAIGGIISSAVSCVVYGLILSALKIQIPVGFLHLALIGAFTSAFSQLGDLVASAVKRDSGVKDFGNILPGHGGFMDRFDSVVYITPVIFYILVGITRFM